MFDQFFPSITNPWIGYVLSGAIVLAAAECGHLIGRWWQRSHADAVSADMLTLEGAALGLLALMIGFTFSMALNRFDVRLSGVGKEANAIATTALRARLLPEPQASQVKNLLKEYVQLRLDPASLSRNPEEFGQTVAYSNELQAKLWQQAVAVSAADPHSIPAGLFVQALNEMIDLQETRLGASRNRVPRVVFVLLYGVAAVSIAFAGYVSGLGHRRRRVPVAIMALLVASVIGMTDDIDRSQSGFIAVSQRAMHSLKDSLE